MFTKKIFITEKNKKKSKTKKKEKNIVHLKKYVSNVCSP